MLRDYEMLYYRVLHYTDVDTSYDNRQLHMHRYYRRMLEMRYFISVYFTGQTLRMVAHEQVHGLYTEENGP